jgi:hypothetical protein
MTAVAVKKIGPILYEICDLLPSVAPVTRGCQRIGQAFELRVGPTLWASLAACLRRIPLPDPAASILGRLQSTGLEAMALSRHAMGMGAAATDDEAQFSTGSTGAIANDPTTG